MRERLFEIHRNGKADFFQTGGNSGCSAVEYFPYSRRQKQTQFRIHRKAIARFPKLNPDWIILGKGPVYRPEIPSAVRSTEIPEPETDLNLFSDTTTAIRSQQHDAPEKFLPASDVQDSAKENYTASEPSVHADIDEVPESEIDRIILLMKDKSCICYRPK